VNVKQLFKRFNIPNTAIAGVMGLIGFLAKYPQVMTTLARTTGVSESITKESEVRKIIREELRLMRKGDKVE
jgi:hypothetical protein